jgi:hypothetical protein
MSQGVEESIDIASHSDLRKVALRLEQEERDGQYYALSVCAALMFNQDNRSLLRKLFRCTAGSLGRLVFTSCGMNEISTTIVHAEFLAQVLASIPPKNALKAIMCHRLLITGELQVLADAIAGFDCLNEFHFRDTIFSGFEEGGPDSLARSLSNLPSLKAFLWGFHQVSEAASGISSTETLRMAATICSCNSLISLRWYQVPSFAHDAEAFQEFCQALKDSASLKEVNLVQSAFSGKFLDGIVDSVILNKQSSVHSLSIGSGTDTRVDPVVRALKTNQKLKRIQVRVPDDSITVISASALGELLDILQSTNFTLVDFWSALF